MKNKCIHENKYMFFSNNSLKWQGRYLLLTIAPFFSNQPTIYNTGNLAKAIESITNQKLMKEDEK